MRLCCWSMELTGSQKIRDRVDHDERKGSSLVVEGEIGDS